ncbi:MAG: OmpA family protein [Bacteroidetes bacterium]|nr:OmpA family protein [Bacteroidota bacterium]
MKRIIISLVFSLAVLPLMAGGNAQLEIAEDLYSRLAFTKAADYYQKYLDKNTEDIYAWQKLAECYDMTNDYDNLSSTLKSLTDLGGLDEHPEVYLSYAEVLQIKGDCDEATKWFQKYLNKRPEDRRATNQLDMCADNPGLIDDQQGIIRYEVSNMEFNTDAFEYSPNIFNKTLLYTSTSDESVNSRKKHLWTGGKFSDLEQYQRDSSEVFVLFNEIEALNTTYNDGPMTMDPLTNEVYYTRDNFNPDKAFKKKGINAFNYMNLNIYAAQNDVGKIGKIAEFPYNSEDYNTGHPTFSPDGKYLMFVSDQPEDNVGGRDLYYCSRGDSSSWGEPVLLTSDINTEGDELFPYFREDGALYFSSDGLGGYGGLDIYRAEVDLENNRLVSLHRMEDNINTSYDDFGITFKGGSKNGYFTSDRPGGQGHDDIYAFEDMTILLRGIVINDETEDLLPGSMIRVGDNNVELLKGTTDENAYFETLVYKDKVYDIWADEDYYFDADQQVSTVGIRGDKPIEVTMRLTPIRYTVKVMDAETDAPVKGAKVDMIFGCDQAPESVSTGMSGTHRLPVYKDCKYDFKVKADGYLAKSHTWTSPGDDANQEVVIYVDKVHFYPISLRSIYYDFDKAYLRLNESSEDLEKLLGFVNDNPELTIQINSHTDARATHAYNIDLSQRRAQSVVDWLIAHRVDESRLEAIGYGETSPVNECVDGVKCSEEKHQLNRRTEFQVVNKDGSTKIGSDARQDIKVDPCTNCPF